MIHLYYIVVKRYDKVLVGSIQQLNKNNQVNTVPQGVAAQNPGIQVIARAAAVLRTLKDHREGLSLGQIAQAVDLPRSTVQRIINALLNERLVMSMAPQAGYRLGPEIQSLAAAGQTEVAEIVRPYITKLSRETSETVDLAEFRHDHMVFIDQVVGTHRLRTASAVGEIFPMSTTANGKASLALLNDDLIKQLFKYEKADGIKKKKSVNDFMREIQLIREQGYSCDRDEHTQGISALGAAFMTVNEHIYAVSIPVPTPRFVENQSLLVEHLLCTMQRIKAALVLS